MATPVLGTKPPEKPLGAWRRAADVDGGFRNEDGAGKRGTGILAAHEKEGHEMQSVYKDGEAGMLFEKEGNSALRCEIRDAESEKTCMLGKRI